MAGTSQIAKVHFRSTSKHADGGSDFALGRHICALDIHRGAENGFCHPPRSTFRAVKELHSRVISRAHARLLWRNSQLFILDQKSTHGTSIQHRGGEVQLLEPFREQQVRDGDVITFGREVSKGAETYLPPSYEVSFAYSSMTSGAPRVTLSSMSSAPVEALASPSKQLPSFTNRLGRRANLMSVVAQPKSTSKSAIPFWSTSPIPLASDDDDDESAVEDESEDDNGEDEGDQIGCAHHGSSQSVPSSTQICLVSDSEDDIVGEESECSCEEPHRTINDQTTSVMDDEDGNQSDPEDMTDTRRPDAEEPISSARRMRNAVGFGGASQISDSGDNGNDSEDVDEPTTPDLKDMGEETMLEKSEKESTSIATITEHPVFLAGSESSVTMTSEVRQDTASTEDKGPSRYTFISVPVVEEVAPALPKGLEAGGNDVQNSEESVKLSKKRSAGEAGLENADIIRASKESSTPQGAVAATPPPSNKRSKASFFGAGMATGFVAGIVGTVIGLSSFALSEKF